MMNEEDRNNDEAQIRRLIDDWTAALRAKNVEGLMATYAPDVVLFDLAPPLQYKGAGAYRNNWESWLPTFQGPVGFERRELEVTVGDAAAFCHSLGRITGKRTDGEKTDVWVRTTVCYRKTDDRWVIAHEHVSVPFYMDGSFKAAVDLRP